MSRNTVETGYGFLCLILQMINFYWKSQRGDLLYFTVHCYVVDFCLIVMLLWPRNTHFLQRVHSLWTSWLAGVVLYFVVPIDWGGSTISERLLSESWHMLILISPLILARRYGFVQPTFKNQVAFFASMGLYYHMFLGPMSIATGINLNAQLCHLPGDMIY